MSDKLTVIRNGQPCECDVNDFIDEKINMLSQAVGAGTAINALSGGVDSSVVTALGHRALGSQLLTYFIDNGLMRESEPDSIAGTFAALNIPIEIVDAREKFFTALADLTDPEVKREAITQMFYGDVFSKLVCQSGARFLLQGTILTDIQETKMGIKRQHNVFAQIGIDPEKTFGYQILEPLVELRKDGVRLVGRALGLPDAVFQRQPFPGPALAARVIGEVTKERVEIVRQATKIVENIISTYDCHPFQCLAILHQDQVTGMCDGKRQFGYQIEVRCWDSIDACTATPTELPHTILRFMAIAITQKIPSVVSVTYNITAKPPSTIEAI